MKRIRLGAEVFLFSAILIGIGTVPLRAAQEPTLDSVTSVEVTPSSLTLEVGETATLTATALDAEGNPVEAPIVFISRSRRNVGVTNQGEVEAFRPGEYTIVAMVPRNGDPDDRDDDNQSMRVERKCATTSSRDDGVRSNRAGRRRQSGRSADRFHQPVAHEERRRNEPG